MHKTGLDEMLLDLAAAESQRDFHVPVLEIISLMLREHVSQNSYPLLLLQI